MKKKQYILWVVIAVAVISLAALPGIIKAMMIDSEYDNSDSIANMITSTATNTESMGLVLGDPLSDKLTINTVRNRKYNIHLSAKDIADFSDLGEITILYDAVALELIYLCSFTKEEEPKIGTIPGIGLTITNLAPGEISFTVDKTIPSGKVWSGALNTFKFKALKESSTTVSIVDVIQTITFASEFPDANFRAEVLRLLNNSDNGNRQPKDLITKDDFNALAAITNLSLDTKGIASLNGIKYFAALKDLRCLGNQLTELNLSQNTALKLLYCSSNRLTELDLANNTALTDLSCSFNKLTELDVSKNTLLTSLQCGYNQLTELDLPNNTKLSTLLCQDNQFTKLDISNYIMMNAVNCSNNRLTELDVTKCTLLDNLACGNNQLEKLDISDCTRLKTLNCGDNLLTELDISKNTYLNILNCNDNQLTELNLANNTALTSINCQNNRLTGLDVSKHTKLTKLTCRYNDMESADAVIGWQQIGLVWEVTFIFNPQTVSFLPIGVPSAPQNFTATAGSEQAALRWEAPLDNGNSLITGYQVSKDGGVTWLAAYSNSTYVFTGLTNGTEYTFKVRAQNIFGNGAAAEAKATPNVTESPFPEAKTIVENEQASVTVIVANKFTYFKFVPKESGTYAIGSSDSYGGTIPLGYLYGSSGNLLADGADFTVGSHFRIIWNLNAGETYYIGAYGKYVGTYKLTIIPIN